MTNPFAKGAERRARDSEIDTSAEAVEAFIQTTLKEAILSEGLPRNSEDTQDAYKTVDMLRSLAAERDALESKLDEALARTTLAELKGQDQ